MKRTVYLGALAAVALLLASLAPARAASHRVRGAFQGVATAQPQGVLDY